MIQFDKVYKGNSVELGVPCRLTEETKLFMFFCRYIVSLYVPIRSDAHFVSVTVTYLEGDFNPARKDLLFDLHKLM